MISIKFLCGAAPGPPNRLNKLPAERFKFSLILIHLANGQWRFKQANHGTFSNLDTQVGALNKDFGDVSQTDLTVNLVPCVAEATQWAIGKIPKTVNLKLNICISTFVLVCTIIGLGWKCHCQFAYQFEKKLEIRFWLFVESISGPDIANWS